MPRKCRDQCNRRDHVSRQQHREQGDEKEGDSQQGSGVGGAVDIRRTFVRRVAGFVVRVQKRSTMTTRNMVVMASEIATAAAVSTIRERRELTGVPWRPCGPPGAMAARPGPAIGGNSSRRSG